MNVRTKLIEASIELFSQYGFNGTSIDQILTKSGIARKTLYAHFSSKNDLILASLQHYNSEFLHSLQKEFLIRCKKPKEKLLVLFDIAKEWFEEAGFFGCIFVRAAGEFADSRTAINKYCVEAKSNFTSLLNQIALEAGYKEYEKLSSQLVILFEGAVVIAYINQNIQPASQAKNAARILLEHTK